MKPYWKGRILILVMVLTIVATVYVAYQVDKRMDWEDRWKHDVEGVIWGKTGGGLSATGWYIADLDDLEMDEEGNYYYPVNVSYDRVYPGGTHPGAIHTPINTSLWLPGRNWNDYEVGDYFEGRLEHYSPDPGPSMSGLVTFALILAIPLAFMGIIIRKLKEWD